MIKISDVVKDIVYSSEIALSALSKGYLNLSAYAKSIHKEVEERAKKEVRRGSIVVALSRFEKTLGQRPSLLPEVPIEDIAIRSGLAEIAFDKTRTNLEKLKLIYKDKHFGDNEFFLVTHGAGEIALFITQKEKARILRIFQPQKPKLIYEHLAALTVRFDGKYIEVPNVIYALTRRLALKRINIVEMVSTYTEITYLVKEGDLQEAFLAINQKATG